MGQFGGEAVSRVRAGALLGAELEGRAVQCMPQLQPAVAVGQALAPVPLALPTGSATQLHPTWVGG